MARLVFDRGISMKLDKSEVVIIPEDEVWKVAIPVGNGQFGGEDEKLGVREINGILIIRNDTSTPANFRPGNFTFGSGTSFKAGYGAFISGIAFKVVK